jgi:serine-type D-Ala-D-Ala carboxypeptidase/endopeptidase
VKHGHVLEIEAPKRPVSEAITPIIMSKGIDAGIAEYRRLEREQRNEWDFAEKHLNQLGYAMLQHNQLSGAIAVFLLNVEKFPNSSNVYDSLGEAYMKAGDTAKAIVNYEKSLALNPHNDNARQMLKKLRGAS